MATLKDSVIRGKNDHNLLYFHGCAKNLNQLLVYFINLEMWGKSILTIGTMGKAKKGSNDVIYREIWDRLLISTKMLKLFHPGFTPTDFLHCQKCPRKN